MAAILAALAQLLPLITSTVTRIIAERGAAQGKSDGEILREAEAMIPVTAQRHLATLAKALARKAAQASPTGLNTAQLLAAPAPTATSLQQVDRMIELLQGVRAELVVGAASTNAEGLTSWAG